MRFKMSANELLLKCQLWVMQDNVSDLKKRYLFFSGLIVYALGTGMFLTISYFDPMSKLRQVQDLAYSIVETSLYVGLILSLISMGLVCICRWGGVKNLYSSMLSIAILDTLGAVLFQGALLTRSPGMIVLNVSLVFGSGVAVAWLSLRLNRFFSVETPSFKLGYQLGFLVGRLFRFLRIW